MFCLCSFTDVHKKRTYIRILGYEVVLAHENHENHFVLCACVWAYVYKSVMGGSVEVKCRFNQLHVGQIHSSPELPGLEKGPEVHFDPLAVGQNDLAGFSAIFFVRAYPLMYVNGLVFV